MADNSGLARRLLGELAVIVVGVLIALWVDGWAERRAEAEARDFLLQSLEQELRSNIVALDSTVLRQGQVLSSMRALLQVRAGIGSQLDPDSLRTLLVGATSYWRSGHFGVAFDAYDAMVATGSGSLLPTREVGLRLAKHRADLENGQGDEPYAERAFEDLLGTLRLHGGWYSVADSALLSRLAVPAPSGRPRLASLISDPSFAEALFSRVLWETNITDFYEDVVEDLRMTLQMLDERSDGDRGAL